MPETLKIDQEFEKVIPPLSDDEFKQLTENILSEGEVFTPIFTWNGFIVDGHHRYKIIQQHPEVKYRVLEKEFDDRYEAISWICNNQLGRRNLSDNQITILIGKRYKAEKKKHGGTRICERLRDEDTGRYIGNSPSTVQNEQLMDNQMWTAEKIAKEMNISPMTVRRAEAFVDGLEIADEIRPGIEREVISGIIKPSKKEVIAITKAKPEEREEMVEELRLPKEVKEERRRQRALMDGIHAVSTQLGNRKKAPTSTETMLSMVMHDVEFAITTFEVNLSRCRDAFTDIKYKPQLEEIIEKLDNYIKKLKGDQRYAE